MTNQGGHIKVKKPIFRIPKKIRPFRYGGHTHWKEARWLTWVLLNLWYKITGK